jgi:hypothetical protein
MEQPFPGPERDGEQPSVPGRPAGDGAVPSGAGADDGYDYDGYLERLIADTDAGLVEIPQEGMAGLTVGGNVGLGELAGFAHGRAADAMAPGLLLGVLTEQAAADPGALSDDELLGVIVASRRQQAHDESLELTVTAEYAQRGEAALAAAKARGDRRGHRDGEFAEEELGFATRVAASTAGDRMELSRSLALRLPETFAGMGAGRIEGYRARIIRAFTRLMPDEAAAEADRILAEYAARPDVTGSLLRRRAVAVEMRLDPAGVRRRKEEAAARLQRVQAWREDSGNGALGGREMPPAQVLASMARINADAASLRRAGLKGTLRELRVLVFNDRLQGLDPFDRLRDDDDHRNGNDDPNSQDGGDGQDSRNSQDGRGSGGHRDGSGQDDEDGLDDEAGEGFRDEDEQDDDDGERFRDDEDEDEDEDPGEDDGGPHGPGGPGSGPRAGSPRGRGGSGRAAPLPALLNIIVSAGTLLGLSATPAQAGSWGLLDPGDTRKLIEAASRHPRTRWCVTVTDPASGEAIAHGCARGTHPWKARDGTGPPGTGPPGTGDYQEQLAELLRQLKIRLAPIAKGTCDHRDREDRYTPSRRLGHLVRARTARCCAPGCGAQAVNCELDHSTPYPEGPTDQCNLGPPCPRHHTVKHAPGWKLEQTEPGVMRWTGPSGRVFTTRPTSYET